MMHQGHNGNRRQNILSLSLLCCLAAVHLAMCFSPFRITQDVIRYMLLEEWMEQGFPKGTRAYHDFLPYGYSSLLFLLAKLHIYHSFVIALVNNLYLAGSLFFVSRIFGRDISNRQWLFFVLLSWVIMKHSITPLSDMQFLFFSSGSIYYYQLYRQKSSFLSLAAALLFFAVAFFTRTAAIALFIALLASLLHEHWRQLSTSLRNHRWMVLGLILAVVMVVLSAPALRITDYLGYFIRPLRDSGLTWFVKHLSGHFTDDWSGLFVNAPSPKIPFMAPALTRALYAFVGAAMLGWISYLFIARKIKGTLIVKYYLAIYIVLILAWPYHEGRFWLPILPFLAVVIFQTPAPSGIPVRYIFMLAKGWYVAAGIFALSYYTYTSFNKKELARLQDAGVWSKEYETHFFGKPLTDTLAAPNKTVVRLLDRID